jgi:hypothetical protein
MAELSGAVREWDLVESSAVTRCVPVTIASGSTPVAAAAVAATLLLLAVSRFRVDVSSNIYHAVTLPDGANLPRYADGASLPPFAQDWVPQGRHILSLLPLDPGWFSEANLDAAFLGVGILVVFVSVFALLRIIARLGGTDAVGLAAGALLVASAIWTSATPSCPASR